MPGDSRSHAVRRAAAAALIALVPAAAEARPGFYIGLGFGGTDVDGSQVPFSNIPGLIAVPGAPLLTTDTTDGFSGVFRLGFNILGYAALEAIVAGNANNIGQDDIGWAGHAQFGGRVYPMWYWQDMVPEPLQPLEPSIFFGGGLTYQVYEPAVPPGFVSSDVGWRRVGTWRLGFGLEYYISRYFKVGFEYHLGHADFDTFIFNFEDDIRSELTQDVGTDYHQIFITALFHIDPFDQPGPQPVTLMEIVAGGREAQRDDDDLRPIPAPPPKAVDVDTLLEERPADEAAADGPSDEAPGDETADESPDESPGGSEEKAPEGEDDAPEDEELLDL